MSLCRLGTTSTRIAGTSKSSRAAGVLGRDPLWRAPPVLVLSGSLDAEASAREAGADAFVVKPVRTAQLLDVVVQLTRGER